MRKTEIKRSDFVAAFVSAGLDGKQQENIFKKMESALPKWEEMIEASFLNEEWKMKYKALIKERLKIIL